MTSVVVKVVVRACVVKVLRRDYMLSLIRKLETVDCMTSPLCAQGRVVTEDGKHMFKLSIAFFH